MHLKQKQKTLLVFIDKLRALPKKYTIPVGLLVFLSVIYTAAFVVDKPVIFSYAGETCVQRLTLLPDLQVSTSSAGYEARPAKVVKIGSWPVAAWSVCLTAHRAPAPGTAEVSLAPYGGIVARQTFAIKVGSPVSADARVLERPVPVSRPLKLKLSGADTIFSYALHIGGKWAKCTATDVTLACGIDTLGLEQSRSYDAKLVRQFNGKEVAIVVAKEIKTLSATTLTDTSIKSGTTVYDKPTEIIITADKKIIKSETILYKVDGDNRQIHPTTTTLTDKGIVVAVSGALMRSANYELVTQRVEAIDGSGLVEPHTVAFTTSGGPKVTGANVGTSGVPPGSTVVVTFDQALSDKQDVNKYITLSGGIAITGRQGNQLFLSTSGVPKCGDFTIKISGDLQSQYEISGHSTWSFTSRTICYTTGTIGTSAQGRPIVAYYFGSGTTSVFYTGGIHGSEVSTKTLMDHWIQDLDAKARTIPAHITVVVVPAINPDGIARGSRVNANNVDLNRNFATSDWQKDITTVNNQPFPGGGGESAMSEPETKAISGLAQRLRPKVILSYHSIGSMVAANQAGGSTTLAATYAQLSGYRNITGQSDATFEYSVTGTADDWYAQAIGVPSLLIELGSHSYHQFERNQAAMWAMISA